MTIRRRGSRDSEAKSRRRPRRAPKSHHHRPRPGPRPLPSPFKTSFDAFLASVPGLARAIVWRKPSTTQVNGVPTSYPNWTKTQRQQLEAAWTAIVNGQFPRLSFEPRVGLSLYSSGELFSTYVDPTTAWEYFVSYVAQSLAVESQQAVPWSLADYQRSDLVWLLDSQSLFYYTNALNVYFTPSEHGSLPSLGASQYGDPVRTAKLLTNLRLIGRTQRETIEKMLDWCRANMVHFYGSDVPANHQAFWQYQGWPPIDRVLNGTTHAQYGFAHWTAGCWGTAGFLRNTLRTLNIPASLETRDGHALPHFHLPHVGGVSQDLYLSHGDDPYNTEWTSSPAVPISALPLDDAGFQSWFGPNAPLPPGGSNVGRQTVELGMQYLSNYLLRCECNDIAAGTAGTVQGSVYDMNQAACGRFYSIAQLQAMNLFSRLDAKINSLGGCANIP